MKKSPLIIQFELIMKKIEDIQHELNTAIAKNTHDQDTIKKAIKKVNKRLKK